MGQCLCPCLGTGPNLTSHAKKMHREMKTPDKCPKCGAGARHSKHRDMYACGSFYDDYGSRVLVESKLCLYNQIAVLEARVSALLEATDVNGRTMQRITDENLELIAERDKWREWGQVIVDKFTFPRPRDAALMLEELEERGLSLTEPEESE